MPQKKIIIHLDDINYWKYNFEFSLIEELVQSWQKIFNSSIEFIVLKETNNKLLINLNSKIETTQDNWSNENIYIFIGEYVPINFVKNINANYKVLILPKVLTQNISFVDFFNKVYIGNFVSFFRIAIGDSLNV